MSISVLITKPATKCMNKCLGRVWAIYKYIIHYVVVMIISSTNTQITCITHVFKLKFWDFFFLFNFEHLCKQNTLKFIGFIKILMLPRSFLPVYRFISSRANLWPINFKYLIKIEIDERNLIFCFSVFVPE